MNDRQIAWNLRGAGLLAPMLLSVSAARGDAILEIIQGPSGSSGVLVTAANSDCSVVVGRSFGTASDVFLKREGEAAFLLPPTPRPIPSGVNFDGTLVCGNLSSDAPGWVWSASGGVTEVEDLGCATSYSHTFAAMNDDGDAIFNACVECDAYDLRTAILRAADGEISELERETDECILLSQASARAITADGTVYGWVQSGGARWTNGSITILNDRGFTAASVDGTVQAGGFDAEIYVRTGGADTVIGGPGIGTAVFPHQITRNQTMLAGSGWPDPIESNHVWTPAAGWRDPVTFLVEDYGIDPGSVGLYAVGLNAIADDDSVVVGNGFIDGQRQSFRICRSGVDTDGDGLDDLWERCGIPYGGDTPGVFVLDIDGDGRGDADYRHKDLFVEVDAMSEQSFSDGARSKVELAFLNAPLTNPDGIDGVNLHILKDETTLPLVDPWETDGCWPLDFANFRTNNFGTASERANPALIAVKALVYRYCIVARTASPKSIGGCAPVPGRDMVIFAGAYDDESAAAVFMHELGHNLGLRHGGGDSINGKPNYPSIMNYTLSYPMSWSRTFWQMDYSRAGAIEGMEVLDETSLDETIGVGASSDGRYDSWKAPFGVNFEISGGTVIRQPRYVRLNGDHADFGDTIDDGFQDGLYTTGVEQDLNFMFDAYPVGLPTEESPGELLVPYHDWNHVVLALPSSPGPQEFPEDELTVEMVEWLQENLPDPPCLADLDGSGAVDVADLLALLAAWGSTEAAYDVGPEGGDGVVDVQDLLAMLSQWGTCSD